MSKSDFSNEKVKASSDVLAISVGCQTLKEVVSFPLTASSSRTIDCEELSLRSEAVDLFSTPEQPLQKQPTLVLQVKNLKEPKPTQVHGTKIVKQPSSESPESPNTDNEVEQLVKLSKVEVPKTKRRVLCNEEECKGKGHYVDNIIRHLRETHRWTKGRLAAYRYSKRKPARASRNPVKICPQCGKPQTQLGRHLQGHGVPKNTDQFRELVNSAKRYKPAPLKTPKVPKKRRRLTKWQQKVKNGDSSTTISSDSSSEESNILNEMESSPRTSKEKSAISRSQTDFIQHNQENFNYHISNVDEEDKDFIVHNKDTEVEESDELEDEDILTTYSRQHSPFLLPDSNDPNLTAYQESLVAYKQFLLLRHGPKEETRARAEVSKIDIMVRHSKPNHDGTLLDIWSDEIRLYLSFFKYSVETRRRKDNTLKGYSVTLQDYLSFLLNRTASDNPKYQLDEETRKSLKRLQTFQEIWRKGLKPAYRRQKTEQIKNDIENLLALEEVKKIIESSVYAQAREELLVLYEEQRMLGSWTTRVSCSKASLLRNFLMFKFILTHSARTGLISNLTMEEFNRKRFNKDTGLFEVDISRHESVESQEPVVLLLTPEDVKIVCAYIGCARPHNTQPNVTEVFINNKGNHIPSNNVSDLLKSFGKKCGVHNQMHKNFNATTFQKMWRSHMELTGKTNEEKANTAVLMTHSRTTVQRWYDMTRKGRQVERAVQLMERELTTRTTVENQSSAVDLQPGPSCVLSFI